MFPNGSSGSRGPSKSLTLGCSTRSTGHLVTRTRAFRGGPGNMPGGGLSALRTFFLGATIGAGVGAGVSLWWFDRTKSDTITHTTRVESSRQKPSSPPTLLDHPALRFGIPYGGTIREFGDFVSYFDTRTRNPQWVIERLTAEGMKGPAERKHSDFSEDGAIPAKLRNRLDDFRGSGYDRGHLAPAAAHKKTQKDMDETFTLSNISPQVGRGFNRDYWARFEKFTKDLTRSFDEVYVVTGALFLPTASSDGAGAGDTVDNTWVTKYNMIGVPPQLTSVPTHFYKVVLGVPKGDGKSKNPSQLRPAVASFVMPNDDIAPSLPLSRFSVPLDALERASGLIFFPSLTGTDSSGYEKLDKAAVRWQLSGVRETDRLITNGKPNDDDDDSDVDGTIKGSNANGALAVVARPSPSPPESSQGKGKKKLRVDHLCDVTKCVLPIENWWENASQQSSSSSSSRRRRN